MKEAATFTPYNGSASRVNPESLDLPSAWSTFQEMSVPAQEQEAMAEVTMDMMSAEALPDCISLVDRAISALPDTAGIHDMRFVLGALFDDEKYPPAYLEELWVAFSGDNRIELVTGGFMELCRVFPKGRESEDARQFAQLEELIDMFLDSQDIQALTPSLPATRTRSARNLVTQYARVCTDKFSEMTYEQGIWADETLLNTVRLKALGTLPAVENGSTIEKYWRSRTLQLPDIAKTRLTSWEATLHAAQVPRVVSAAEMHEAVLEGAPERPRDVLSSIGVSDSIVPDGLERIGQTDMYLFAPDTAEGQDFRTHAARIAEVAEMMTNTFIENNMVDIPLEQFTKAISEVMDLREPFGSVLIACLAAHPRLRPVQLDTTKDSGLGFEVIYEQNALPGHTMTIDELRRKVAQRYEKYHLPNPYLK